MKVKSIAVGAALWVLAGGLCQVATSGTPDVSTTPLDSEPLPLDLSPFFWERFVSPARTNMELVTVSGRQMFDGLPFQVDGRACLYGRALARQRRRPASDYPDILGVKVGRAFDELHLLHATQFTDREGEKVAVARFNYADGTRHEFPIIYGGHVRDWQRLQSEAKENYSDPDTKVIWRGPGVARFKSTTRMSKTRLINPFPKKSVLTIDFISTGKVASYDIAAATVAGRDPKRPVTPPVPLDRPERNFDGALIVHVVNEAGQPIEGVWVSPNISVAGSPSATVATPVYTATDGACVVLYPKRESACIYFAVDKEGWRRIPEDPWLRFGRDGSPTNGIEVTIRMTRESPGLVADRATGGSPVLAARSNTSGASTTAPESPIIPPAAAVAARPADLRPHPILIIDFPVGSNVRVEFADRLSADPGVVWQPLEIITNLPASPYPYICGRELPQPSQRFYRAALLP